MSSNIIRRNRLPFLRMLTSLKVDSGTYRSILTPLLASVLAY